MNESAKVAAPNTDAVLKAAALSWCNNSILNPWSSIIATCRFITYSKLRVENVNAVSKGAYTQLYCILCWFVSYKHAPARLSHGLILRYLSLDFKSGIYILSVTI